MSKYPQLAEMGIRNAEHIARYALNSIGYTDVLRIRYIRPKGSLLPKSRTYRFPRVQKETKGADGKPEVVMESSPELRAALDELHALLDPKQGAKDIKAAIGEELRLLEEEIALRNQYIRKLVDSLPGD